MLSRDDAIKICQLMGPQAAGRDTGMGREANHGLPEELKESWPEHNWRVILDRSGERGRWVLTIDDADPREHYVEEEDEEDEASE